MLKLIGQKKKCIYDRAVDREFIIPLDKLKPGEKITVASDTMFQTMFCNETRIKYAAKLLSYFIEDVSYEQLLNNLKISNAVLDKKKERDQASRVDFIANFNGDYLNIEMNNNYNEYVMDRNVSYSDRTYSKGVERGVKINNRVVRKLN